MVEGGGEMRGNHERKEKPALPLDWITELPSVVLRKVVFFGGKGEKRRKRRRIRNDRQLSENRETTYASLESPHTLCRVVSEQEGTK